MTVRRRETVHRLRYFRFCNVLHIWTIRAIPTYRVYRLYDMCIVNDYESDQFAHYVMIYERVYGEIYDVPEISVHFDACADSVYIE